MELHKKEKEKKHALALIRERTKLWNELRQIKPIKLDKPIQHGYVRTLELRNEIKYRNDYLNIKKAFELCGYRSAYHSDKNFIKKTKKGTVEKHAHMATVIDPRFRFYWSEDKRVSDILKIEESKKYLTHCGIWWNCSCKEHDNHRTPKDFRCHFSFKYPWMIEEKTKPHMLTHYTPKDSEIESRLSEINNILQNYQYDKLLYPRDGYTKETLSDWSSYKYDDKKYYHTSDFHIDNEIELI
jgi:hypothetical protein